MIFIQPTCYSKNFYNTKKKKKTAHTVRKSVSDCPKIVPKILFELSENSSENLARTVRKQSRKFSLGCPKIVPKIKSGLSENSPKNSIRTVRKICLDCSKIVPKILPELSENSLEILIQTIRKQSINFSPDCLKIVFKFLIFSPKILWLIHTASYGLEKRSYH